MRAVTRHQVAITPVARASVRAALWETGVSALKLGATGYIITVMFVFGPSLLMIGS